VIKAIIFDFFGVIVTEGFKQFRETYFSNDKLKEALALDLMKQVDSGLIDEMTFTDELANLANITPEKVHQLLGNNMPNQLLLSFIRKDLLGKFKIGMLSNSGDNYPDRLLANEDLDMFDDILLSYKFGIVKPQQEIYELAAERLGIEPAECLFIDDSEGHCTGAEQAGMKSIFYQSFLQFKKDMQNHLN
jgi:HAD superfamily hydrolase (TIGR01509 family)